MDIVTRLWVGLIALGTLLPTLGCGTYNGPTPSPSHHSADPAVAAKCAVPPLPKNEEVKLKQGRNGALTLSWLDRSSQPSKRVSYTIPADDHVCKQRLDILKLGVSSRADDLLSPKVNGER